MSVSCKDVETELSRDHWLAAHAATQIADAELIENIETEALEALSAWVDFELQDRDNRTES